MKYKLNKEIISVEEMSRFSFPKNSEVIVSKDLGTILVVKDKRTNLEFVVYSKDLEICD
ncbi:hypothetical protein IL099_002203 [Enterococcus hirae]|nr:hypothetical protein [Enterococcus hirae]